MKQQYFPPEFKKEQFTCPHCGVLAKQEWSHIIEDWYKEPPFIILGFLIARTTIVSNIAFGWTTKW